MCILGEGGGGCSVVRGGEQSEVLRKRVLYIPSRRSHSFSSERFKFDLLH